jgi:transposase
MSPTAKVEVRAKAIGMLEAGMLQKAVAEKLRVSKRSVIRWWKQHRNGESLEDKPRPGRPEKIHPVAKQVISLSVGKRRQSTRKLAARLTNKGYKISKETVRRHLKNNLGMNPYRQRKKPFLTCRHKKARIQFAKDKLHWTLEDWKRVVWSDESPFQLFPTSNTKVNQVWAPNPENIPKTSIVKFPPKILVWGMFGHKGVSELHFVPEKHTVTGDYYREEILEKFALPALQRRGTTGSILEQQLTDFPSSTIFMQDGARPHTTLKNQKWIEDNFPLCWRPSEWPGNSPNLNPIENLWAIIKQRLSELRHATNFLQLKNQVKKVWSELDPSIIENLKAGIPERVKKVVKLKGDYIGK